MQFKAEIDKNIKDILSRLSLKQKIELVSGIDRWQTYGCKNVGLPSIFMADGPHGVRREPDQKKQRKLQDLPATCFPSVVLAASTWDTEVVAKMGEAIASECIERGVDLLLAPGTNIKRSPLCGRNFEYFSEDPLLAGTLAAAYINGVQKTGVGACLKHFAANNQETGRMAVNSIIDDRALREIYLKPFEIAIKTAAPYAVMSAYNRVNGEYCGENKPLTDILRGEFGFEGALISDWGAVCNRSVGIKTGLDLEMPHCTHSQKVLNDALINGFLTEDELDKCCARVIRLVLRCKSQAKQADAGINNAHAVAKEVLVNGAVLLKNDQNMLPLAPERVAVIGAFAKEPRYQGGGSSHVNTNNTVSFLDALAKRKTDYDYAAGYKLSGDGYDAKLIEEACAVASKRSKVLIFAGLTEEYESEGYDRVDLNLPKGQLELIRAVASVNPNVAVVLHCGSPVHLPFLQDVKAVLNVYLGGEAVGDGAYDLLFGYANPSGKLAETFPISADDCLSSQNFAGDDKNVQYRESIFVGYRYFDTAQKPVQFPFGFGLSYTKFEYGNLCVDKSIINENDSVLITVDVANVGTIAGKEVVQLYIRDRESSVFKPEKELKAYAKIALLPSEKKTVRFVLQRSAFEYYNVNTGRFCVEAGLYDIMIGASSQDIRLTAKIMCENKSDRHPSYRATAPEYYQIERAEGVSEKSFSALFRVPINKLEVPKPQKGDFNVTFNDLQHRWRARLAAGIGKRVACGKKGEPLRQSKQSSMMNMPLFRWALQFENMPKERLTGLLNLVDGNPLRGVVQLLKSAKKPK